MSMKEKNNQDEYILKQVSYCPSGYFEYGKFCIKLQPSPVTFWRSKVCADKMPENVDAQNNNILKEILQVYQYTLIQR